MYVPTRGRGSIQSWLSGLESVARCAYEPCSAARSIRACILHACTSGSPDLSQKPVVPAPEKSRSISVEIFAGTQGRRVDVWKKKYPFKNTFSFHFNSPFFSQSLVRYMPPLNAKSSFVPPSVLGISHGVGILRGWWPPVERAPMNHPNRYRRHRPTLPSFFPSFARKRW